MNTIWGSEEHTRKFEESLKYGDHILPAELAFWQEEEGKESPVDPLSPNRGRERLTHYFANLPKDIRDQAVEEKWAETQATKKQLFHLEQRFRKEGYYLLHDDFSVLEACMLIDWVNDIDNLAKQPYFDLTYVFPFEDEDEEEIFEDWVTPSSEVENFLDMFLIKELTPMVVYTYYNEDKEPIYVGKSISFYDQHYFHNKDEYFDEIEYVGLRVYVSKDEMDLGKLFWLQQLKPKYNRTGKHANKSVNMQIQDDTEELVLYEWDMVDYWQNSFIHHALDMCGMKAHEHNVRKRNW